MEPVGGELQWRIASPDRLSSWQRFFACQLLRRAALNSKRPAVKTSGDFVTACNPEEAASSNASGPIVVSYRHRANCFSLKWGGGPLRGVLPAHLQACPRQYHLAISMRQDPAINMRQRHHPAINMVHQTAAE